MTSPPADTGSPNVEPTAHPVIHEEPTSPDLSNVEPEVDPEEQVQEAHLSMKDIFHHHYKDDPFCAIRLLNLATVKITENTTNETLELELEGTYQSVSSNQPIIFRIEGADELISVSKDIYRIKLAPL